MSALLRGGCLKQRLNVKGPVIVNGVVALHPAVTRTGLFHGGSGSAKISEGEGARRSYQCKLNARAVR